MSIDASTLPVSPIFVIAVIGYAAVSALVTGPGIAEREIAKSGWQTQCQSELIAELETAHRPERHVPQVPDIGGMICAVYPKLNDLCAMIPDPNAGARAAEERLRAAEEERLRLAASNTADQCSCAIAVYIENQRLGLALYAASGRFVTSVAISGRDAALTRSLHSPACAFGKEG